MPLPNSLYTCAQVKALDQAAINKQGIAGFELMQRAAQASFELMREKWPNTDSVTVLCGGGNNAGDGYVLAALAAQADLNVRVYYLAEPLQLTGDARRAYDLAAGEDINIAPYHAIGCIFTGVIVDALLGIGVKGIVRPFYQSAITQINAEQKPVLSIDIPSGLCGDSGQVLGCAVRASATLSFIALKAGLLTGQALDYVGELSYAQLGVSQSVLDSQQSYSQRLDFAPPLLNTRFANSHKGQFGRVLVIGGDKGFGGAAIMAAESALIAGAGIVNLATQKDHIAPALARRPELMVSGVESTQKLEELTKKAGVLVLGPGLGCSEWSRAMLTLGLAQDQSMVVDADGLNLLAKVFEVDMARDNWVLTPHPAEAARLLHSTTASVQQDRYLAARTLQQRYGGVVVLKGAGSIIADASGLALCSAGNPAMSTPGMGDVLAGLIGGLLALGLKPVDAAKVAVWAHATAGDRAADKLGKHLFATEIYPELRDLW